MDNFHDRQYVWLRSRVHGTYLHANSDGKSVSLRRRRAALRAAWAVHIHQGAAPYLLLYSAAYGRYLAATATRAPLGHIGFRAEQRDFDQPQLQAIMWEAAETGFPDDVLLRNVGGRYLRANGKYTGKYLGWNKGVTVDDIDNVVSTMMYWTVEPIPLRDPDRPLGLAPPTLARRPRELSDMLGRVRPVQRLIRFVRASAEGAFTEDVDGWSEFHFRGMYVYQLRNELYSRIGPHPHPYLLPYDIAMCVRAGRYGRLTPLVVNLPRGCNGETLQIVVYLSRTPVHMELRYPDVDAELLVHRSESTMDASGEYSIAERRTRGMAGRTRGGIIPVTRSLGVGPVSTSPTGWAELPVDVIQRILGGDTLCNVDRVCAPLLNRHWRKSITSGVEEIDDLANQPWLFLPSSVSPCFFNPMRACLHPIPALPEGIRAARPCGSYPGGWLFLDGEASGQDHLLYNLKSGQRIPLPSTVINMQGIVRGETSLLMCALSQSPSCTGYEVATVLNQGHSGEHIIALWSPEAEHWLEISGTPEAWDDEGVDMRIVDMCYYSGAFHLLTRDEGLLKVIRHTNGSLGMQRHRVVRSAGRVTDDMIAKRPQYSLDRRLVESTTGDLLMLIKISRLNRTGTITLYRLAVNDDTGEAEWLNYVSPAGEVIYLGMGSSRSYVTDTKDEIHFLDDVRRTVDSEDTDTILFSRDDMGCFLTRTRLFGGAYRGAPFDKTSDLSPPVWFHH